MHSIFFVDMREAKMPLEQEKEMVERAQQNLHNFAPLYEYYVSRIYRYISFKVREVHVAEDLTAQVFCEALEHLSSFQWRGVSFGSWLYKIAYHTVTDYYKKPNMQPLDEELHIAPGDMIDDINTKWSIEKIYAALQQLPEISQQIVALRISEELSHQEIGIILGKSEDTVKVSYSRAVQQLRKIILVASFILFLFWHMYG